MRAARQLDAPLGRRFGAAIRDPAPDPFEPLRRSGQLPARRQVCRGCDFPSIDNSMDDRIAELASPRALLEAIQTGSQAALKRLYELESRRLYGIALRIVKRPELAADVLQDAFFQVWQKSASFSAERGDAAAWLTSIVRYRALDILRRHAREYLSDDPRLGDRIEEPDLVGQIDDKVAAEALRRCLQTLDDNQRRSIALAFIEGLSHAEIAARDGAPLGTVKSWVRRGLIALRACMGR